jgi:hypothetical protein
LDALKTYDNLWEWGESESQPIINDWRGAWVISSQVRVFPEPKHG